MSRRKAFTLVELLVVIAIIALLIAILAPSLKAAKDLAKSAYCKTTINALNKSAMVYAEMNGGHMMVQNHKFYTGSDGVDYNQGGTQPDRSAVAFGSGGTPPHDPRTGLYTDTRQYGIVYAAGIMGPAEMFYCPAAINDERHMLRGYPRPWGTQAGSGSSLIRCGFMWDPWVKPVPGDSDPNHVTFDDSLIPERHPTDRFLTTDLILSRDHMGHQTSNSASWNHGYIDGHVDFREYSQVYAKFLAGLDARLYWPTWQEHVRKELEKQ